MSDAELFKLAHELVEHYGLATFASQGRDWAIENCAPERLAIYERDLAVIAALAQRAADDED